MKCVRSARTTQVRTFLRSLLKKFGYTDAEELHDNITNGFMLIGKLKEGVGWPSKPDVAAPPALPRILCS